MIEKAVLPAAGLGTRLLPATKEQPKEMLPIFAKDETDSLCLKPVISLVFDQLYGRGLRKFCFIVGRGKRAIEDFFTRDNGYTQMLKAKDKSLHAELLEEFYSRLDDSSILWVNQPEPKGFGDAVLRAKPFVENETFLVHAGDTVIISDHDDFLGRLMKVWDNLELDAAFIVQEVADPKAYGVILGEEVSDGLFKVGRAVEKPDRPMSNYAIMPVYIFKSTIFEALEKIKPGKGGEIQLTDAIQMLIDWGLKVYAVKLRPDELRLDIGTTTTYWEALNLAFFHFTKGQ